MPSNPDMTTLAFYNENNELIQPPQGVRCQCTIRIRDNDVEEDLRYNANGYYIIFNQMTRLYLGTIRLMTLTQLKNHNIQFNPEAV